VAHERIDNAALLELDVELLIPAALEGVIGTHNADRIRAPIIAEVANGPIEGSADAALHARGISVLPDVLTNAGGVIVSYFEWVQNRQGDTWTLEQVRLRLEEILLRAFGEIWELVQAEQVSFRRAAYTRALRRIAAATFAQGDREYFASGR
jgi:glutamate dehydrogenase (NADP+)